MGDDVYSWLLASADQLPYPGLEPNPLDAESIGIAPLGTDDHSLLSRPPVTLADSLHLHSTNNNSSVSSISNFSSNNSNNSSSNNHSNNVRSKGKAKSTLGNNNGGYNNNNNNNNNNNKSTAKSNKNITTSGRRGSTSAGRKRASSSGKRDEKQNKRAKQTREDVLERNRRSARECRERKKERVHQLEERVKRLEQENMQLRVQLRIGRETDASETAEKWRITNLLGDMIKEGDNDDAIEETIAMFTERYADYGKERRVACRYHLDYLEKLLVPTQVSCCSAVDC